MLDQLPEYLADYDFPYSILNELDPQSEAVASALEAAGLAILAETWQTPEEVPPEETAPEQAVPEQTTPEQASPQPAGLEATQPVAAVGNIPVEAPHEAIPQVEQGVEHTTGNTGQSQPTQQNAPASHEETQPAEGTANLTNG